MGEARIAVRVTGLVQGVGFRPMVFRVARDLALTGFVFNDSEGVGVEVEGKRDDVLRFPAALREACPPLARIDSVTAREIPPEGSGSFVIKESREGRVTTAVTPDAATCNDCARDMFDSSNRRYRYAFTNCTNCGPRFTITRHLPYDRPQTSMAPFAMCPECLEEYTDPLDRRFHAQPNACPACGPQLRLLTSSGLPGPDGDPIAEVLKLIQGGAIVAVKGLGGFHLACDAGNEEAVELLRKRKKRSEKPLAVMAANAVSARRLVLLTKEEEDLLLSPAHPIVLAKKTGDCDRLLPGVAPGLAELGVMLPYTPLHLLLFHEAAGRPEGVKWLNDAVVPLTLVMTSANPGGEPLVIGNREAIRRLGHIADYILVHDREILIRCDDSVTRFVAGKPRMVRRARGWTPRAVKLAFAPESILATGPGLKSTACLTRGNEAFLSQHIGDLENASSCRALELAVSHLEALLEIKPTLVAHDLHPDFFSTRLAFQIAEELGLPRYAVQHHRAHIGLVMAEHGIAGPARGLAMDGVGLGTDGKAWGGEMLDLDDTGFRRVAHLVPLALPGGDKAAREPWRMASSVLFALRRGDEIGKRFPDIPGSAMIGRLIANPRLTGTTTALGRWFDAAAALLGLCLTQHDESTAAMRLEAVCAGFAPLKEPPRLWEIAPDGTLSLLPLMNEIANGGKSPEDIARSAALFHDVLADALADWVTSLRDEAAGRRPLCLSGGCFLNRRLTTRLLAALESRGLHPLLPSEVPPGDGGVALGQAWCAALALRAGAAGGGGDKVAAKN